MECCKRKTMRDEETKKKLIARINRLAGQMNGVAKMIKEDRYCDDILIQLSSIDKSIKSLANILLDSHMHSCLVEDIKNDKYDSIDEIIDLFRRFQ